MTSVKQLEQSSAHCMCSIRVRNEDDECGDDGGGGDNGIQPPLPGKPVALLFRMLTPSLPFLPPVTIPASGWFSRAVYVRGSPCT